MDDVSKSPLTCCKELQPGTLKPIISNGLAYSWTNICWLESAEP